MKIPRNTIRIDGIRTETGCNFSIYPIVSGNYIGVQTNKNGSFSMYNCPVGIIRVMDESGALTDISITTAEKIPETVKNEYPGIDEKIADYYRRTFPWSTDTDDLSRTATFYDLFNALDRYNDVYSIIGPYSDSIIRENLFSRLAEIIKTDYDYIYEQWLRAVK